MGHCNGLPNCCCLHRHTLPLCHFSGPPHTLLCSIILTRGLPGRLRASIAAAKAPNLPWAPIAPPHAAARSTVSHGVPCTASLLLLSPSPHLPSAMCHFQVSSHTAGVFNFL
ncbi:unnamed protein product, partial [Staurois parvus]